MKGPFREKSWQEREQWRGDAQKSMGMRSQGRQVSGKGVLERLSNDEVFG